MIHVIHVLNDSRGHPRSIVRLLNTPEELQVKQPAILTPLIKHCMEWEYTNISDWIITGHHRRYAGTLVVDFEEKSVQHCDMFLDALRLLQYNLENNNIFS